MNTLVENQPRMNSTSRSFRSRLTMILTVGIMSMVVIGSISSALFTTANIREQLLKDGFYITESLSRQSVLGLLYDSADNVDDAASAAMAFPSVKHVSILKNNQDVLLKKGENTQIPPMNTSISHPYLASETSNYWLIAAPVMSESSIDSDDPLLLQTERSPEQLGYVLVRISKEKISELLSTTIATNLIVGLSVSIMMLLVIHLSLNRLVNPLAKLARLMAETSGEKHTYAIPEGPREVVDIALAYNEMITALDQYQSQLRHHNELLEYEVDKRTQELVYARDMAIQANQNKSTFLSNISHELRTPLQSIIGYSDLIQDSLPMDMEDTQGDLNTIIHNANTLLKMINSILDMAKIESGKIDHQPVPTHIKTLIEDVVETIKPLLANNHNQLDVENHVQNEYLMIDADKLHQILLNLLSNAVKFTHSGRILLKAEQQTDHLIFTVSDTGIGMSEEQYRHIFEPFYQIDDSITRAYQGTGLGLAISQKFSQLMGGNISVESHLNHGSTFTLKLPYQVKDETGNAD